MVTVVRWTGREARALRDALRMSVRDFSAHTNISAASIADMEAKGERTNLRHSTQRILDGVLATASADVQQRFSDILHVRPAEASTSMAPDVEGKADFVLSQTGIGAGSDAKHAAVDLPALRRSLDAYDLPPDGPVRPVDQMQAAVGDVVQMRLESRYHQLGSILPQLLAELGRALGQHKGQRRTVVAGLLVQAYRAADAIADKYALFDLSARIIDLMTWAAGQCHDEPTMATAAYVRAETFFANGDYATGRRLLVRAADRLLPGLSKQAAAAYGALHMRAAVLAAHCGRDDLASDHIDEAGDVASRLAEGVYLGTVFGSASVRIHRLSLAVESGDVDAALRSAERWAPPADVPAERRSHFYIDLARAQAQAGTPAQSLASLDQARLAAPEHVRVHPEVRQLVATLTPTGTHEQAQLAELTTWVGLPTRPS